MEHKDPFYMGDMKLTRIFVGVWLFFLTSEVKKFKPLTPQEMLTIHLVCTSKPDCLQYFI